MRNERRGTHWLALALVGALVAACAEEQDAEAGAAEDAAVEAPAAAPQLNDASIAHIAVTANTIDAEAGELAQERASDQRVRDFAATMVRDHRGVNEQAVALATRLGVTPADNDVSRSLQSDAAAAAAQLEPLSGAEFDRAYMEREVAYHAAVLDALDTTLIPNTSNAELRALLETARGAVAAHLEHARMLSASLSSASAQ